ncbi:LTA synthase family protein [Caulobacter sp. S45]|uniref:LTA synthase family protein n=1 Tax=Caulobacter sp. S45 TaxID=1641861 RepID=UPI001C2CFB0C|nr:LTA synthase family protein [Caulobacter sp. S45]
MGLALALAGWLIGRRVARARVSGVLSLLLDMCGPLGMFLYLAWATSKPIFAGLTSFSLLGGLAFADFYKRETLREPVIFSDMSELIEVGRHPELYLPFVGPKRVIAGAVAAVGLMGTLCALEPAAWAWSPWRALASAGTFVVMIWMLAGPLNPASATLLRRFHPSDDPAADSSRLGPLVSLILYGVIARAERSARATRAGAQAQAALEAAACSDCTGPVVLVQCESFTDPRHLRAGTADASPRFDEACSSAWSGRLTTPTWGANTVRTEFEVLTGIDSQALGYDRFNPYHGFVQAPLPSVAFILRAQGYRTVCVHPYDRRFYNRHRVLPRLGFDAFYGIEAFAGAETRRGFVTDAAVAEFVQRLLDQARQPLFIFVITMENHGPWAASKDGDSLATYVQGVSAGDAMLGRLADCVVRDRGGVLGFYGDHGPALTDAGDDLRTDYIVCGGAATVRVQQDASAFALGGVLLSALSQGGVPAPAVEGAADKLSA